MRGAWRTLVGTLIVLVLLSLAALLIMKPRQAPVTQEVLREKEQNESAYLDFIRENFAGGGPQKDGIPAIDNPVYLLPAEAELYENLRPEDVVFGVDYKGKVLALPQKIMYWHEILNDEVGGENISVTYCPLTGSVIGYRERNLGVSGMLYNSNLVMYDRETDSNIPQMLGQAVDGPLKGVTLETFDVVVTTWEKWRAAHPDTLVLSRKTGFRRTYDDPPYQGYETALLVWFPVAARSDRYHSKRIIHGIEYDGLALAVLKENVGTGITYETPNDLLTITYDRELDTVQVTAASGREVKDYDAYWFAWFAYHPDTIVINDASA